MLSEKYDGSFINMLMKADKKAQNLLQIVTNEIPSFNDITEFKGLDDCFEFPFTFS